MDSLSPEQAHSDAMRRKLRLQSLRLNDPTPEQTFDRVARIAASLAQAPLAMVNFINDQQQMFRGMYVPPSQSETDTDQAGIAFGIDDVSIPRTAPSDYGFCPHVVAQGSQLILDDICAYPRFAGNPLVNDMGVRSYLGTPLRDHTGMILGTLCVADRKPRKWGRQRAEGLNQLAETLLAEFRLRDSLLAQQQELFAVFDSAPFPIMLTEGPEHLLRYANGAQGAAFGRVQHLSPGRHVLQGLDTVGVFDVMDRAFNTGQTSTLPSAPIATYDTNSPQAYAFTCTPVRLSPKAPVSGVLTVAMNITTQAPTGQTHQIAVDFGQQLQQLGAHGQEVLPGEQGGQGGFYTA